MEQRRYPGHNHWFYESQTSPRTAQAAPLVPEAAHIDDRFLLGCYADNAVVQSLLRTNQPPCWQHAIWHSCCFPIALSPR